MKIAYEKRTETIEVFETPMLSDLPHIHNEIEIIYVEKGKAVAYADRNCIEIKTNNIFIAFPNQVHYYKNCSHGKYCVLIISPELIYGQKNILCNNVPEINIMSNENNLGELIINACKSYKEKRVTESVGYLNLLMGRIINRLTLLPSIQTDNSTLRSILEYCSEHFTENLCLDNLAHDLHLSKYYISRLLNNKLNLGFNDYINMLRVRLACEMLLESNKKIADISEDVGFGTIRSMNRSFKQIMNMTPFEYKNLNSSVKNLKETSNT